MIVKQKRCGISLITLTKERGKYTIEAKSDWYRFWKTFSDEMMLQEYWMQYCFWVWMIEAIPLQMTVLFATSAMRTS